MSGFGRPAADDIPGKTLALRNKEYGTIIIGLVGNAKKGCWGGIWGAGDGGVLQETVSTGEVGEEPDVQLEVVLVAGIDDDDLTICLELQ